jgi:hypothetical protein
MTAYDSLYSGWTTTGSILTSLSILAWTMINLNYNWFLIYDWLHSDLKSLLYSVSVSKEMFADHLYPQNAFHNKLVYKNQSLQKSVCQLVT